VTERRRGKNYLSGLKFIFHAVLKTLAFNLHRGQHQTVSHEMGGVSDAFTRFETENFINSIGKKQSKNNNSRDIQPTLIITNIDKVFHVQCSPS